jgi:hypothetical protein
LEIAARKLKMSKPIYLKAKFDPAHLLQAIENSLEHHHETSHGVTGLTFKGYTIVVHKRKGFCWQIECKFKTVERDGPRPRAQSPGKLRRSNDKENDNSHLG